MISTMWAGGGIPKREKTPKEMVISNKEERATREEEVFAALSFRGKTQSESTRKCQGR